MVNFFLKTRYKVSQHFEKVGGGGDEFNLTTTSSLLLRGSNNNENRTKHTTTRYAATSGDPTVSKTSCSVRIKHHDLFNIQTVSTISILKLIKVDDSYNDNLISTPNDKPPYLCFIGCDRYMFGESLCTEGMVVIFPLLRSPSTKFHWLLLHVSNIRFNLTRSSFSFSELPPL